VNGFTNKIAAGLAVAAVAVPVGSAAADGGNAAVQLQAQASVDATHAASLAHTSPQKAAKLLDRSRSELARAYKQVSAMAQGGTDRAQAARVRLLDTVQHHAQTAHGIAQQTTGKLRAAAHKAAQSDLQMGKALSVQTPDDGADTGSASGDNSVQADAGASVTVTSTSPFPTIVPVG
jgi:hypothetical protein